MITSLFSKKKRSELETFEGLLETHLNGMYRLALSFCRNPATAEDLVNDTCVRALRFKDKFEMGTNFKAWIYTVLHHTFVHRYRRQKREREILEGTTRQDVEATFHSHERHATDTQPENSYLDSMLSDDILRALEALPEEFRVVVTLCDLEGLSYREIADIVDRPIGTVMSRLYRGRRILEESLRDVAIARGVVKAEPEGDQAILDIERYRRRKKA